MALKCVPLLLIIITCFMANASATRELPGFNDTARLDGSLIDCWNAVTELKSCTNEIILFFMNGQMDIGPACCQSITLITHHCWPAMLTSLGFTPQECDILRGYCDAFPGPSPSPALHPLPTPNSVVKMV